MKRYRTNPLFAPLILLRQLLYLSVFIHVNTASGAYTSLPRWGQATSVVDNVLYVSGGKTDQYGAYSYTSAPTTNDLFCLVLSNGFDTSTPPWNYISGSEDASSAQGPVLAWHSLAAYNTSHLLLFGGDGGPNSRITLPNGADSAQILDVGASNGPRWIEQSEGWANQPSRRIHHTISTVGGKVYLIGGEKDDGSSLGYSDHYVFDPSTPSFTRLPTTNGPSDIYGHASVPLSDGRLLVFGGYSQSEGTLVPFTTIWSLNAASVNNTWTIESVSRNSVPSGRRAFAYTWLEGDQVLIHGGTDAQFQTSYSDGWILDAATTPMTWTNVSALTQIGARRDHFAVQVGSQVLFGFGYGNSAGASVGLLLFNYDQATFTSSFSPQSGPSLTTLPVPGGTEGSSSGGSGGSGSSGGSNSSGGGTSHGSGGSSGGNSGGTSDPNNPGPNGGDGNGGTGNGEDHHKKEVAVIVVASIFGLLAAALAAGFIIVFIIRRRRTLGRFHLLNNEDEHRPRPGAPAPWKIAGIGILPWFKARRALARGEKTRVADTKQGWTVLGLGRPRERVDMLANEDASEFAVGRGRCPHQFGSGDSRSWYSAHDEDDHERRESGNSIVRIVSGSLNSLRNIGSGVRRVISGGSDNSHGYGHVRHPRQWTDVSLPMDPYEDSEGLLLHDKNHAWEPEEMDIVLAARPRGGRKESSNTSKFTDPFQDPGEREVLFDASPSPATPKPPNASKASLGSSQDRQNDQARSSQSTLSRSSDIPQLPPLVTTTSKNSSNEQSSFSLIDGSAAEHSSSSSNQATLSVTSSTRPRTTSIINAFVPPTNPVKRSDSWWTRFKRPRSNSNRENSIDYGRQPFAKLDLEFRDPNPPPGKLSAIKEASGGSTFAGDSPPSSQLGKVQREKRKSGIGLEIGRLYLSSGHGQSTSSLKTSRTADSAALERLAGRMDVAFRETTGTSVDYASSVDESRKGSQDREETVSPLDDGAATYKDGYGHEIQRSDSPERGLDTADGNGEKERRSRPWTTENPSARPNSSPPLAISDAPSSTWGLTLKVKGKSPISLGTVASRVADYERRMSQELTPSNSTPTLAISSPSPVSPRTPRTPRSQSIVTTPSPTTKPAGRRQHSNVKYGLVQRPELFIANPDSHRHSASGFSDI